MYDPGTRIGRRLNMQADNVLVQCIYNGVSTRGMERTHAACARRRFGWSDDNEAARVIADSNMCEGRWAMGDGRASAHCGFFFFDIFVFLGRGLRCACPAVVWTGVEILCRPILHVMWSGAQQPRVNYL